MRALPLIAAILLASCASGQKVHTGIVPHPNPDLLKDPDRGPKKRNTKADASKTSGQEAAPDAEELKKRSEAAKRDFRQDNACPVTNRVEGDCPGYVICHIKPLACGGADKPGNMQWLTVEAAEKKDKADADSCKTSEAVSK